MASAIQIATPDAIRRIQRVQTVTIAWMSVEALVSLFAAWRARSPALLAFGGDSAIELLSAIVVLWRFRAIAGVNEGPRKGGQPVSREPCCSRWLLLLQSLRSQVCWGILNPNRHFWEWRFWLPQQSSCRGLAREKRRLSSATGSAALRADGAQSTLCAYLSLIALAGLTINTIWRITWADPIAALAVLPLVVWEGREAMRGKACGCC